MAIKDSRTPHKIILNPPMYMSLVAPNGFLHRHPACHALWHYYCLAENNVDMQEHGVVLEGQVDPVFNFRELFKNIALLYGVAPEEMLKFWINVDMQAGAMGFKKLDAKYRHLSTPEILTQ